MDLAVSRRQEGVWDRLLPGEHLLWAKVSISRTVNLYLDGQLFSIGRSG